MITDIQKFSADKDRQSDLDFAARAVVYLEKMGLSPDEVVDYLVDEFELDVETARTLVTVAA